MLENMTLNDKPPKVHNDRYTKRVEDVYDDSQCFSIEIHNIHNYANSREERMPRKRKRPKKPKPQPSIEIKQMSCDTGGSRISQNNSA